MGLKDKEFTILHVEDDPSLANLVRICFHGFGFRGNMLAAGRVEDAFTLLDNRERNREPLSLVLVDMQLPDGTGLDVIRKIKNDPFWRLTPVIVLSSELAPGTISAAYALGANCFVSKNPRARGPYETLRALYTSWIEDALLPEGIRGDRLQYALSRAIHLRARTAEFYLGLARIFEGTSEMGFWLDRSLNEGNLANLMAFLQPKLSEKDLSPATIDKFGGMQQRVQEALNAAEQRLQRTHAPRPAEVYSWILDITAAFDEEALAEVIGCLFPKAPQAIAALRARASSQHLELANHILERTEEPGLRQQAAALHAWAESLAAKPDSPKLLPGE